MSRKKKRSLLGMMIVPAVATGAVVFLSTMNACTPSDHNTELREDAVAKDAAEAEAAEAQAGKDTKASTEEKSQASGGAGHSAHTTGTVAAGEKKMTKTAKSHRVPASAGGVYVVQVGAFKVKENAEKLQAKLQTAGYQVGMHTIEHSKNGTLHLVQFEPTPNRAEAETQIEELQSKQDLQAQLLVVSANH